MLVHDHIPNEYQTIFPADIYTYKESLVHTIFGVPQYSYVSLDYVFSLKYVNRKRIELISKDVFLTEEQSAAVKADLKRKVRLNHVKKVRILQTVYCKDSIEFTVNTYTVEKLDGDIFSFVSVPQSQAFYIPEDYLRQLTTRWGVAIYH